MTYSLDVVVVQKGRNITGARRNADIQTIWINPVLEMLVERQQSTRLSCLLLQQ
jgi:hypothetical protein